jgi:hypothetical protein
MNFPDVDLGALTIPIFATIFGAGWASCVAILVSPLRKRMEKLEARDEAYRAEKDKELQEMRELLVLRQRVSG